MAEIIDNLLFASEPGKRPQIAKLAEQHSSGTSSFVMESLDGWANQCSFVVYEVDTDGNPILGSETDWVGIRSGKTIQNAVKTAGIDRDYPASRTYAIATETAGARNKLIEGLLKILNADGTLKQAVVDGLNIKDNTITGNKLSGRTITEDKLGLKSVGSAELKDGAVKANNIDWATIKGQELFFNHDQNTQVSGDVSIDVPVDLANYKKIIVEGATEPFAGDSDGAVYALNSSKNVIGTLQSGTEIWEGRFSPVNREGDQIVAYGLQTHNSANFRIELFRPSSGNWPTFVANGFGGGDSNTRKSQTLMGRVKAGASTVKYVRVMFKNPQSGGWVRAYRTNK